MEPSHRLRVFLAGLLGSSGCLRSPAIEALCSRAGIIVSDPWFWRQPINGMNERRQDFELLREFVRRGNQEAFADLVRRHLDLVYGTALHRVEQGEAAREIAQDVFAALARKACQFGPDDSLPAWLHRTALLEARQWL